MSRTKGTRLKRFWLFLASFFRGLRNRLHVVLSYGFLAFGILTCLFVLVPQCFSRVPALSYYISEHKLPISYELIGEVRILDSNGDAINANVTVFVGGYSTSLTTTSFALTFSSPVTEEIPVTIRYENEDGVFESTQFVRTSQNNHMIHEVFIVYA